MTHYALSIVGPGSALNPIFGQFVVRLLAWEGRRRRRREIRVAFLFHDSDWPEGSGLAGSRSDLR